MNLHLLNKYDKCNENRLFVEGLLCLVIGVVVLIYAIIDSMRWSYLSLAILIIVLSQYVLMLSLPDLICK